MMTKLKAVDDAVDKLYAYKANMIKASEHNQTLSSSRADDFIMKILNLVFKENRVVPDTPRTHMVDKLKEAGLDTKQQKFLIECVSLSHMRGVRFGNDPRCEENVAYVLKEIGLYP